MSRADGRRAPLAASAALATSPATPSAMRLLGAAPDRLAHAEPAAGVEEIGVVIGGQHRDSENSHSPSLAAPATAARIVCG